MATRSQVRPLGPEDLQRGWGRSDQVRWEQARTGYTDLISVMAEMRAEGRSFQEIGRQLNTEGHTTRRAAA